MARLYDLTIELLTLLEWATDPDSDPDAIKDTMEAVQGEYAVKLEGYGKVLKELELEAFCLNSEIQRLKKRKEAVDNSYDRIKKAVEDSMIATDNRKVKTDLFSFGIQKNPKKVILADDIDVNKIPVEFLVQQDPKVDKVAVKAALEDGEELTWAKLVQEEGLRIR